MECNTTGFPSAQSLVNNGPLVEFFIIGDDMFTSATVA